MLKKNRLIILITIMVSCMYVTSCKTSKQNNISSEKSFLEIIESTGCKQITIYQMDNNGSCEIALPTGGKVTQLSKIQEIEEKQEIQRLVDMFANWNQEQHKVPDLEVLDLICDIYIVFNDNLVITYSMNGSEQNYYGRINEISYYLPEEFGKYIDDMF